MTVVSVLFIVKSANGSLLVMLSDVLLELCSAECTTSGILQIWSWNNRERSAQVRSRMFEHTARVLKEPTDSATS